MESRFNFNKRNIDALLLPQAGKRKEYFDTLQNNLSLIIRSTGSRTFFIRRKIQGKSQRVLIGRYPDLSVEQARNRAAVILADIALGGNPNEKKKEQQQEPTFKEIFENYIEGYARERCRRLYDMQKDFERYLSDWSQRKVSTITRAEAQERINASMAQVQLITQLHSCALQ